MRIIHNAKFALFLISIGVSLSCSNGKTHNISMLRIVSTTNATPPYACGLLRTSQQISSLENAGVKCPAEVLASNLTETNWIYSTSPVSEVHYSRQMDMIFLVPTDDLFSNALYFIAIPKMHACNVKMTAAR
jgi:hypothetical protein